MPTNVRDAFFDTNTNKTFVLSGKNVLIYDHEFKELLNTIPLKEVSNDTCKYINSEDTS